MKSLFRVAGVIVATVGGLACGSSNAPANYHPEQMFDAGADAGPTSPTDG